MSVAVTQSNEHVVNNVIGRLLTTVTPAVVTIVLGFRPRKVRVVNLVNRNELEFFEGMAQNSGLKTLAAGTRTVVTTTAITINDNGFTMGVDADVYVINNQLTFEAMG